MRPETSGETVRPADDASEADWAEWYFDHRNDPETEEELMPLPGSPMQLKYRRPGKDRMESTTVIVPENWYDMTTKERKDWAQGECNRVCPGATDVSLR